MKRLLVLEAAPNTLDVGLQDRVLALRPHASYWLDVHRVSYRIPADYGAETVLRDGEEAHWQRQLAWFDLLDQMLKTRLPEVARGEVRPAILYGFSLKCMIDHLVIRGRECVAALDAERPDRVVLWSAASSGRSSLERFAIDARPDGLIPAIWSRLCRARGVAYEQRPALQQTGLSAPALNGRPAWEHGTSRARSMARELEWMLRALGSSKRSKGSHPTFLLLETNGDLTRVLHAALRAGHRCLVRRGHRLIDPSRVGWSKTIADRPAGKGVLVEARWSAAAEAICAPTSPLWEWPNTWFECSMEPLLGPWLRSWIAEELPQMVTLSARYEEVLSSERVDMVVTPGLIFRTHMAAIAAGRRRSSTHTALIAHGDGPDEAASWDLFELFPYHHYFVPTQEFADYFHARRLQYPNRPAALIHTGSYRWHDFTQWTRRPRINRPPLPVPRTKPVLVYVVGKPEGAGRRYLNKWDCAETWYYRLQTALLRTLCECRDYTVIVQFHPLDRTAGLPIVPFIQGLRADHLMISWSPFSRWLPWADRVLMDFPSTPLYEAAVANVPFHLLVHRSCVMRATALKQFAASISWYDQPEEAAEAARRYLRGPSAPPPKLVVEEHDLLAELCSLVGTRHEFAQDDR